MYYRHKYISRTDLCENVIRKYPDALKHKKQGYRTITAKTPHFRSVHQCSGGEAENSCNNYKYHKKSTPEKNEFTMYITQASLTGIRTDPLFTIILTVKTCFQKLPYKNYTL